MGNPPSNVTILFKFLRVCHAQFVSALSALRHTIHMRVWCSLHMQSAPCTEHASQFVSQSICPPQINQKQPFVSALIRPRFTNAPTTIENPQGDRNEGADIGVSYTFFSPKDTCCTTIGVRDALTGYVFPGIPGRVGPALLGMCPDGPGWGGPRWVG